MRLYVDNGSLNESKATSGLSHLIEHLVFNGSRTYKRGELIPVMQKLGLGFGGDVNAYTGLLQTVYKLDLPQLDEETVHTALTIMRDFADGATLTDEAINHERGIVISELKARDSQNYRTLIATLGFLCNGTRCAGVHAHRAGGSHPRYSLRAGEAVLSRQLPVAQNDRGGNR